MFLIFYDSAEEEGEVVTEQQSKWHATV